MGDRETEALRALAQPRRMTDEDVAELERLALAGLLEAQHGSRVGFLEGRKPEPDLAGLAYLAVAEVRRLRNDLAAAWRRLDGYGQMHDLRPELAEAKALLAVLKEELRRKG